MMDPVRTKLNSQVPMDNEQFLIALALHAILLDPTKRDKPPEELAAEAVRWNYLIKQAIKDELANRLSKRKKPYTDDDPH